MCQISIWQPMPPTSSHDDQHPITLQSRNYDMGYAVIWRSALFVLLFQAFPVARSENQPATGQLPASTEDSVLMQSGHSKQLRLEDLPQGRFRSEMESLPPKIQKQALKRLAEMGVPLNNMNSLHVDGTGMLFYACSPPSPSPTQESSKTTPKSN